jgi:hypothetical protein
LSTIDLIVSLLAPIQLHLNQLAHFSTSDFLITAPLHIPAITRPLNKYSFAQNPLLLYTYVFASYNLPESILLNWFESVRPKMPTNKMPSPKAKGNNPQSSQAQSIEVATKMAALEAKLEQLELQVATLQGQLQEKSESLKTSVPPQSKVTVADASKKEKAKSPAKATALQANSKLQGGSKKENRDTPKKTLNQEHKKNMKPQGVSNKENRGTLARIINQQHKKNTKPQAVSNMENCGTPTAILDQQHMNNMEPRDLTNTEKCGTPTTIVNQEDTNNMLIDITPNREDVQISPVSSPVSPPVSLSAYKKTYIASACAFLKVAGPMGSCEVGRISTAVDHYASLQLDIDSEAGALWISSSLKEVPTEPFDAKAQVDDPGFFNMGVVFRSAQIVPESLRFERVVDTLPLPSAILDQLDDQNEVPPNLYYMTWKYYSCGADGFEQLESTEVNFDQRDRIIKFHRHVLGHRQTVQVWFIADAEDVEESFNCLRARCYREAARDWQPCSGHGGNQEEYCTLTGRKRKGVEQFLQQSAPSTDALRNGTLQTTDQQKI